MQLSNVQTLPQPAGLFDFDAMPGLFDGLFDPGALATLERAAKSSFSSLRFNPGSQKYYHPAGTPGAGKFLSHTQVRDAIESDIDLQRERLMQLGEGLQQKGHQFKAQVISEAEYQAAVVEWRDAMYQSVKNIHLNYGAAAVGGFAQMGPVQYGRVGHLLKFHIAKLNNFAVEVSNDPNILHGMTTGKMDFLKRVGMYADTGLFTFEAERFAQHKMLNYTKEQNVPHSKESCVCCDHITQLGIQPISTFPPVGGHQGPGCCGPADLCTRLYFP